MSKDWLSRYESLILIVVFFLAGNVLTWMGFVKAALVTGWLIMGVLACGISRSLAIITGALLDEGADDRRLESYAEWGAAALKSGLAIVIVGAWAMGHQSVAVAGTWLLVGVMIREMVRSYRT